MLGQLQILFNLTTGIKDGEVGMQTEKSIDGHSLNFIDHFHT